MDFERILGWVSGKGEPRNCPCKEVDPGTVREFGIVQNPTIAAITIIRIASGQRSLFAKTNCGTARNPSLHGTSRDGLSGFTFAGKHSIHCRVIGGVTEVSKTATEQIDLQA